MHPGLVGCLLLATATRHEHEFPGGCTLGSSAACHLPHTMGSWWDAHRAHWPACHSPRAMVSGGVHTRLIDWPAIRHGPIDCQPMACRTNRVFDNIHEVGTMGMSDLRSPSPIAVGGTAPRDNGRVP